MVAPEKITSSSEEESTPLFSSVSGRRSWVWNHFGESKRKPNIAVCKICLQEIQPGSTKNTSNLSCHLTRKHKLEKPPKEKKDYW